MGATVGAREFDNQIVSGPLDNAALNETANGLSIGWLAFFQQFSI